MWVRLTSSGTSQYVADHAAAFAMIDDGEAVAVDALPDRSADYETAVVAPTDTAVVKARPRPVRKPRPKS